VGVFVHLNISNTFYTMSRDRIAGKTVNLKYALNKFPINLQETYRGHRKWLCAENIQHRKYTKQETYRGHRK